MAGARVEAVNLAGVAPEISDPIAAEVPERFVVTDVDAQVQKAEEREHELKDKHRSADDRTEHEKCCHSSPPQTTPMG